VRLAAVVVPVKVGDAKSLLEFTAVWTLFSSTLIELALTILLAFPDGRESYELQGKVGV
jgi:hypothetical protein